MEVVPVITMGDRKQPTPIDADEYKKFVQFVKEVHGGTRGHLRTEVENALREYRESYYGGSDRLQRIEDDVAQVKALLSDAEADGGTVPTPDADSSHTHTTTDNGVDVPDEQPHFRASSVQDRGAWLFGWVRDDIGSSGEIHRNVLRSMVTNFWGYDQDSDATENVVERALDVMDRAWSTEDHPTKDGYVVWGDHADDVWDEYQEEQTEEASDTFDRLDDAEVDR